MRRLGILISGRGSNFEAIADRVASGALDAEIAVVIGNREQAYDLAQDVFVKAYKALLNGTVVQPGALSAWLYRIAANTTTDSLRRRRLIAWLPLSLFNEDRGIGAGVLSDGSGSSSESFSANSDESDGRSSSIGSLHERNGYDGGLFENRVADREIVERIFRHVRESRGERLLESRVKMLPEWAPAADLVLPQARL